MDFKVGQQVSTPINLQDSQTVLLLKLRFVWVSTPINLQDSQTIAALIVCNFKVSTPINLQDSQTDGNY